MSQRRMTAPHSRLQGPLARWTRVHKVLRAAEQELAAAWAHHAAYRSGVPVQLIAEVARLRAVSTELLASALRSKTADD